MQTRSFDEIKALYESARAKGLDSAKGSLADYSNYMQSIMPDENWSAGLQPDNWVGSFSRGVDSLLYNTGIPEVTGNVGASLGSGVDALTGNYDQKYETLGRSVGETIPRGLIDTGLIMGGTALTPVSGPLGVGMVAAGIADAGIKGYADTGSIGAGLANAGMMAAAPYVAGGAGALAAKPFVSAGAKAAAATLGGEAAIIGLGTAKDTMLFDGSLTDNLFANTLGSVMFAPFTLKQGVNTYRDTKMKQAISNLVRPKALRLGMEGFVSESEKAFTGLDQSQIYTGTTDHSLVHQGKLFDYLVGGKSLSELPQGSEHLVKFLEDAGVAEPGESSPMMQWETAQRLEKGKGLVNRAMEGDGDVSGLIRKASKLLMSSENDVTELVQMMKANNEVVKAYRAIEARQQGVAEQARNSDRLFRARTGTMPLQGDSGFLGSESPRLFGFSDESLVGKPEQAKREILYFEPMEFRSGLDVPRVGDGREVQVPGRIMLEPLGAKPKPSFVKQFGEVAVDQAVGEKRGSRTAQELAQARKDVEEFLMGRGKVRSKPSWQTEKERETGKGVKGKGFVEQRIPKEVEVAVGKLVESGTPFSLDIEVAGKRKPKGQKNDVLTEEERKAWESEQMAKFGGSIKVERGKVIRKPKAVKQVQNDDAAAEAYAKRLEIIKQAAKRAGFMVRGGMLFDKNESRLFKFVRGPVAVDEGGKLTQLGTTAVGSNGLVHQNRFLTATQMPKQVFELVRKVYPEAWEGQNINVNKLAQLEKERPMFETHVYGQDGAPNPAKAARDQMMHEWYDNQSQGAKVLIDTYVTEGGSSTSRDPALLEATLKANGVDKTKLDQWMTLSKQAEQNSVGPRATSYYDTISPFPKQMTNPVTGEIVDTSPLRIDITVPLKSKNESFTREQLLAAGGDRNAFAKLKSEAGERAGLLWIQDNLHENLPNTLGWAMVQFVPDPRTGETVAFVAEQQSRWGQTIQKKDAEFRKNRGRAPTREEQLAASPLDRPTEHPLLDLQHQLVLDAVITEARKRGVTKGVVSDAVSAMMTQKHDTHHAEFAPGGNDRWGNPLQPEPSQSGGMRQHYDSVLQTAMRKLTGDDGVVWDGGVHKNALVEGSKVVKGSPIFRNPDGTPKTNVTGKIYDLSILQDSEVRYNIRGGNVAQDANGMYTAASVKSAIEQLTPLNHGDQNLAAQRVANMVKADLQTKVDQNQAEFVESGKNLLSAVFRKLGLSLDLENEYIAMADRVLTNLDQQTGAKALSMLSTRAIVEAQKAHGENLPWEVQRGTAGMAMPGTSDRGPLITLSPIKAKLMPSTEPSGIAFEKVHTLAHESVHGTIFRVLDNMRSDPFNPGDPIQVARETAYLDAMEYLEALSVDERTALVRDLSEFTVSHFPDSWARRAYSEDNALYAGSKSIETLTEYGAQVAMHLWADPVNAPSKLQAYLRHLPEPIQQFVQKVLGTMSDLVAVVIGGARQRGWDDVRVQELQQFHKNVLELVKPDAVKMRAEQKVQDALQGPAAIERGDFGGLGVQFKKSGSAEMDKTISELVKNSREPGVLARNFAQHQQSSASQWAKQHIPQYGRVSNILTRLDSEAVRWYHLMQAHFMVTTDGGFLSDLFTTRDKKINNPEKLRMKSNLKMVAGDRKLHEAVNEAMRMNNDIVAEVAQTGEAYPTFEHPDIQAVFSKFSSEQKNAAKAVFNGYLEGNKQAAGLLMTTMQHKMANVMSRYLYGGGFSHEEAGTMGKQLSMALIGNKMVELAQQVPALGTIDPATQQFVPANESVGKAIRHWENVKDKFEDDLRYFDRPHFSEMRTGRYYIRYDSGQRDADGNIVYGSRSSANVRQRDAIIKDLLSKGFKIESVVDRQGKDQTGFGQMRESGLDEAAFRVEQHFQMHKEAFLKNMEPELAKQVEEEFAGFNAAEPLLDAAADKKQYLNKRTFAPGREYIDMITAQNAYTALVARKVANVLGRIDANWEMQHENWLKFPELREEVNQFKNAILNQGRQKGKLFRKIVTALTLGGNVSSAIIDATQPVTMGIWRLTEEVGISKSLSLITKSYFEAFKPIDKMDADYRDVLVRATNEGLLKTGGQLDDMINIDEHTSFNVINAASNRDMVDMEGMVKDPRYLASKAFEMIGKLGNKTLDVGMTPHRMSSQINNRVMLWSGLQVAKSKGLKGVDAQNYAINMMQTANVAGGRAAHSSFKTKAGMFNGTVELATLMTNYPIAAISQMFNAWKGTLKSMGLSAEARKHSQQAFYGQLLTQFALAGSLGLGLDALFRVSKEWFGVDPENEIRKGLATIDESGWIADAVLNGLGNQITGIDLASRYSLSGIGGLNSYTGFEPRGLFGAGGSLISALYNAPNQLANNDLSKVNLIPVGIRRMIGGMTGQGVVDQSGQKMIEPTQAETLMQLVGFKPARLTQMQNIRQRMKGIDDAVTQKLSGERRQMAEHLLKGDLVTPMQWVRDRINSESEYLIKSGADEQKVKMRQGQMMQTEMLELIDYAVDKALPQDQMSVGSKASAPEREALMRSYPARTPLASQLQREQLKQKLAAQVGIRPSSPMMRPRALQQAQQVDQIRQQNPNINLSTAKEIAR